MKEIDGKMIIFGLGISGIACAKYYMARGRQVLLCDDGGPEKLKEAFQKIGAVTSEMCYLSGEMPPMQKGDVIIKSPGIPFSHPLLQRAMALWIPIYVDIEMAYREMEKPIIAVTGTNGKTTTTAWIGHLISQGGKKALVGGNIGVGVFDLLEKVPQADYVVLELSSFQLHSIEQFRPHVAVYTNITPDHLAWHGSFDAYLEDKFAMTKNQSQRDVLIYNEEDAILKKWAQSQKGQKYAFSSKQKVKEGIYLDEKGQLILTRRDASQVLIHRTQLRLKGRHNVENAMAAALAAYASGISIEGIQEGLKTFGGVAHRLEFVDKIQGISYINDSKGTNPDSTIKALEALDGPIHLILGGYDKKASFEEVFEAFSGKVRKVVALGETRNQILETAQRAQFGPVFMASDLEEAVQKAREGAQEGDVILLSPACASWDMYRNFEERGDHFKQIVCQMK